MSPSPVTRCALTKPQLRAISWDMALILDQTQQNVLDKIVHERKNIFINGRAGTGKSFLIHSIVKELSTHEIQVSVVSTTGISARNIKGVTFHRFAGCGIALEAPRKLLENMVRRKNKGALNRWRTTDVLIIDEVSMLDGELFTKMEELARMIRRNGKPFGGIQMVLVGDLYQLGPVQSRFHPSGKWCFESPVWNTVVNETIELEVVYRQRDPQFASVLSQIRLGDITDDVVKYMKSLERTKFPKDGIAPTLLVSTNAEAAQQNGFQTELLAGTAVTFDAKDYGPMAGDIDTHCITPKSIILKRGSQVMLTQNLDEHLVNGSRGVVVGFSLDSVLVKFNCGRTELIGRTVWVLEVLKQVADEPTVSPKLLSEVIVMRTLANELQTYGISTLQNTSTVVTACRIQVPLVLAWAITIHKVRRFLFRSSFEVF